MLIGIFSDTHLGFGKDDRYEEAFARFKECLTFFKSKQVDAIVHAGDLFDDAVPSQEVWMSTFDAFSVNNGPLNEYTKHTQRGASTMQEKVVATAKGIPIIAIHGTHEHRGKDFANAIAILEESNCLVHIHAAYTLFEKNGERVAIHGMGGVPEKHAKEVLEKYNPTPVSGAVNIILLHQSFKEFLPFDEDENIASLSLADLPNGFDLIINGHLHWTDEQHFEGKRFLLTGSTIFTQMKNLESQKKKGMFLFDTTTKKLDFFPFPIQRQLFYHKVSFNEATPEEVTAKVLALVREVFSTTFAIKPLVRIKLAGTLKKGFTQSDIQLTLGEYADKGIFSIAKGFTIESFEKKIESLRKLQEEKKGVVDIGVDLLEKNVLEAKLEKFDTRRMFTLLSQGENEKAEEVLLSATEN